MREAIGLSDTILCLGQNVYVFTRAGYTSCSKSLVDGILLHKKAPTHSAYVGAINSGGNALAVIGVEKVASALGLEILEACLP